MFVCLSVCVFLYSSQVFGSISIKLAGWMQGRVMGSKVKVTGSKVKVRVTGVKSQIMIRSRSNLVGRCREGSRGQKSRSRGQRSRSLGSKVKVTGVKGQIMVRSPSNLVGGCRKGSRGQRSRSLGSKRSLFFSCLFVPLLLPSFWSDLHQTW